MHPLETGQRIPSLELERKNVLSDPPMDKYDLLPRVWEGGGGGGGGEREGGRERGGQGGREGERAREGERETTAGMVSAGGPSWVTVLYSAVAMTFSECLGSQLVSATWGRCESNRTVVADISGLLTVSTGCLAEFNRIVSVLVVLLSVMIRAVLYLGVPSWEM